MNDQPHAVVLLSGGLDSTTCLALAKSRGYRCSALSFDYGQRQRSELVAAARIAAELGAVEHMVMKVDIAQLGGSALTSGMAVPKGRSEEELGQGIPVTYVPARNTIFLAHALALAEVRGAFAIYIGVNAVDYSGYPDCRPEYVAAFETLANLATAAAVEKRGRYQLHAPLLKMTKADIIRCGMELGIDYSLTHSCYDPLADPAAGESNADHKPLACGACDACLLRRRGFINAGQADPTAYATPTTKED